MSRKSSKRRFPPRLVLAIDPAKKAGLALFLDGKLIATRAADGSKWAPLRDAISAMLVNVEFYGDVKDFKQVVIEDGWILGPWNSKGALTLGRRRGLAQGAAEACGFIEDPVMIGPSTWQCALFGKLAKDESKLRALQFCHTTYGLDNITEDEADAVCLGHYALTHLFTVS